MWILLTHTHIFIYSHTRLFVYSGHWLWGQGGVEAGDGRTQHKYLLLDNDQNHGCHRPRPVGRQGSPHLLRLLISPSLPSSLADRNPQADLPWERQSQDRPRGGDRVQVSRGVWGHVSATPQQRVLHGQHRHGRLAPARHTSRRSVRLPGQAGFVIRPPGAVNNRGEKRERVWKKKE